MNRFTLADAALIALPGFVAAANPQFSFSTALTCRPEPPSQWHRRTTSAYLSRQRAAGRSKILSVTSGLSSFLGALADFNGKVDLASWIEA